jgi:hypothetical protein
MSKTPTDSCVLAEDRDESVMAGCPADSVGSLCWSNTRMVHVPRYTVSRTALQVCVWLGAGADCPVGAGHTGGSLVQPGEFS